MHQKSHFTCSDVSLISSLVLVGLIKRLGSTGFPSERDPKRNKVGFDSCEEFLGVR